MSYIYEALKRAEDENAKGVAAPRPVGRPAFFAARPRWWLWALIAVLGANAAVLVTLILVRGSRSPDVTMATTASTEPVAGPLVSPPPGDDTTRMTPPAPQAAVPPASTVAPTPPVARPAPPASPPVAPAVRSARSAAAPSTPPAPPSARPVAPSPPVAERPTTPVTPSVPRLDPPPPASTPSAVARPASPPTAAPAAPVSPSGSAVPAPKAPTGEGTAPPAVETPKLQIQAVVYSDVPAQRMVFIDGRRYAEGDKIDAETVVERITPEGAVVTRRGQRFALTSGRP